jgi:hypothetical protein
MEIDRKKILRNILINCIVGCIIITALIFIEIYYVKNILTIKNIIIKVAGTIIIGIALEIYIVFIKSICGKYNNFFTFKKGNYLQWVLVSLVNGVIFFGLGAGTILIFTFFFIIQPPIRNLTQILSQIMNGYLICLIGGIIFSVVLFILCIVSNIILNKKEKLSHKEIEVK